MKDVLSQGLEFCGREHLRDQNEPVLEERIGDAARGGTVNLHVLSVFTTEGSQEQRGAVSSGPAVVTATLL